MRRCIHRKPPAASTGLCSEYACSILPARSRSGLHAKFASDSLIFGKPGAHQHVYSMAPPMVIRTVLILALLTQQVAVWPCLSICRMLGDCAGASDCCMPTSCAITCEQETTCASSCGEQAECALACESSCEVVCESVCDERAGCECGIIGHLACASAAIQPMEQGPPTAPATPHLDLVTLLALPVSFVALSHEHHLQAQAPSVDWAWRSSWTASHRRSVLCCWLI